MCSLKVLILAAIVSQHFCVQVTGSLGQITTSFSRNLLHEGLFNFLSGALHNFPSWVYINKLDPFQLPGEFVTIKDPSTNITLTVTNQHATGFSEITHVFNSAVSVGLDAKSFSVSHATNDKILLEGEYEATGLYQENIHLNSRGQFSIVCVEFWQGISFDNLTIGENDTYIHLYTGNSSYSSFPTFENVSFTNISWEGDQSRELNVKLNTELAAIYFNFIARKVVSSNNTIAIPSSRLFTRYIYTLFWKTKVIDILNWPSVSNWDAINYSDNCIPNVFVVVVLVLFHFPFYR